LKESAAKRRGRLGVVINNDTVRRLLDERLIRLPMTHL
jgi:hypothetical protein